MRTESHAIVMALRAITEGKFLTEKERGRAIVGAAMQTQIPGALLPISLTSLRIGSAINR
jgi:hypothetical protein